LTKTLNLDALNPEKAELILGGRTFDVTRMPMKVFLTIQKKFREGGVTTAWYREPLQEWLSINDDAITTEWIEHATEDATVMRAIERNLFDPVIVDPLPVWISDQSSQDPEAPKNQKKIS
jgi:hypothetical protein